MQVRRLFRQAQAEQESHRHHAGDVPIKGVLHAQGFQTQGHVFRRAAEDCVGHRISQAHTQGAHLGREHFRFHQAADRGAYICQSQSLNIFMENANFGKLTSMHFYGWEKGLKTGMYYLRTKAATDAIKFTVDKSVVENTSSKTEEESCAIDNGDDCEMCSG